MTTPYCRKTRRTVTISALILSATAGLAVTGCDSPSAASAVTAVQGEGELDSPTSTLAPAADSLTAEDIQRRREIWMGSWAISPP